VRNVTRLRIDLIGSYIRIYKGEKEMKEKEKKTRWGGGLFIEYREPRHESMEQWV
jgi:hypothetical protein